MIKRLKPSKQAVACIAVIFFILFSFLVFTRENERRIMEQNTEYIQDSTLQIAGRIDNVLADGYESIRILSAFLSQSLNQPEERGEYKNAVLADAIVVFEANLTKNLIGEGIWRDKDGNRLSVEELLGLHLPCDYDTYIVRWADTYVEESARELFLKNTDRAYLNKLFEQGKSEITFDYYAKSLDGEKIFVRRSTYLAADKRSGDVIAYHNVKDITEQKRKENQMRQYEQMLVMTTFETYRGIRQVDLSDFSTTYLSLPQR